MTAYLGQIIMFAGDFAPEGWAFCDGRKLLMNDHAELFSFIGTMYGGDGIVDFALPDLRGRIPLASGGGPPTRSLRDYPTGVTAGNPTVKLTSDNLPKHNHTKIFEDTQRLNNKHSGALATVHTTDAAGTLSDPGDAILAVKPAPALKLFAAYSSFSPSEFGELGGVMGGLQKGASVTSNIAINAAWGPLEKDPTPISTLPPHVGINFLIATQGIFPPKS